MQAPAQSASDHEGAQWDEVDARLRDLFEQLMQETGSTNAADFFNAEGDSVPRPTVEQLVTLFRGLIVHPSFGIAWDEVPPPTLTNASAMAEVNAFITANGWNMDGNGPGIRGLSEKRCPIQGLPWREIRDRRFQAVTADGILYVMLRGWNGFITGVAFNPRTNAISHSVDGFKPLGDHWYVWVQTPFPDSTLPRIYEGHQDGEPAAAHEPPPRPSVSDAPDGRTLDSLPAPSSSGGR